MNVKAVLAPDATAEPGQEWLYKALTTWLHYYPDVCVCCHRDVAFAHHLLRSLSGAEYLVFMTDYFLLMF